MAPAWKTYADAWTDARWTFESAKATAYAGAVSRWAVLENSPTARNQAAGEAAKAARVSTMALLSAAVEHSDHAAQVAWAATVAPAWATEQNAFISTSVTEATTMVGAGVTYSNAVADADLAESQAAANPALALIAALVANRSAYVSSVVSADQVYGDAVADHALAWDGSVSVELESLASSMITHEVNYMHAGTGLDVLYAGALGEAVVNWAGTVAGQLTGVPYTWVTTASSLLLTAGSGSSSVITAFQAGQTPAPAPDIDTTSAKRLIDSTSDKKIEQVFNLVFPPGGGGLRTGNKVKVRVRNEKDIDVDGPCGHYASRMIPRIQYMVDHGELPKGTKVGYICYDVDRSKLPPLPNGKQYSATLAKHIVVAIQVPGMDDMYYDAGYYTGGEYGNLGGFHGEVTKEQLAELVNSGAFTFRAASHQ